jgi:predicted nucleotidyltransferase
MRPSIALELQRQAIRDMVGQFRAANPRVFGSVLTGADVEGSDLDLLVDTLSGATLFDLGGLQEALQDLLGVPVDVVATGDIPSGRREEFLNMARPI